MTDASHDLALGCRVWLKYCMHGPPGTVTGFFRGKVVVAWSDLGFTGRHTANALVTAATFPHKPGPPGAAQSCTNQQEER